MTCTADCTLENLCVVCWDKVIDEENEINLVEIIPDLVRRNRERVNAWRKANPEKANKTKQTWAQKNKEHIYARRKELRRLKKRS